ncbi:hypothetical protein [Tabrizicola sp.]|uniref:hypothetical protein n=1 Tax=Tabrizicola sp. TaxID=2005166 RepID=UPI00286BAC84|nr:hypothetical protein [Tabrizicola sp.]
MYRRPIIPADFTVPERLETVEFHLRPLTVHDLVRDYDAVMSSTAQLREQMGDSSSWPAGLTLEDNLVDLGWHQREFSLRHSFAYTVISPDGERCLGCCYIYPASDPEFDVDARYWARQSRIGDPADVALGQAFRGWLAREWPFRRVAFPGRAA